MDPKTTLKLFSLALFIANKITTSSSETSPTSVQPAGITWPWADGGVLTLPGRRGCSERWQLRVVASLHPPHKHGTESVPRCVTGSTRPPACAHVRARASTSKKAHVLFVLNGKKTCRGELKSPFKACSVWIWLQISCLNECEQPAGDFASGVYLVIFLLRNVLRAINAFKTACERPPRTWRPMMVMMMMMMRRLQQTRWENML